MISPFFIDAKAIGLPHPTPKFEFSGALASCSSEYPIFLPTSLVMSLGFATLKK